MKLFNKLIAGSLIAAGGTLSVIAQAQQLTCDVVNTQLIDLHSATFDAALGAAVTDDGSFFGVIPGLGAPVFGVNRAVTYSNTSNGNSGGGVRSPMMVLSSIVLL